MPDRSVKMKRRIFGFQRRVWWPKCTPASSSSRMETTDKLIPPRLVSCRPAESGGTGARPGTATRVYRRVGVLNASILSDAGSSLARVAREPALASEIANDVRSLVERAEERQRSGMPPDAVVAELLALGRLYDRRGRKDARARVDA